MALYAISARAARRLVEQQAEDRKATQRPDRLLLTKRDASGFFEESDSAVELTNYPDAVINPVWPAPRLSIPNGD